MSSVSARLRNPQKHLHGSWQITFEDRFFQQEMPKGPRWFKLAIFTSFCFRSPQISRSQSFRKQNFAPRVWPSFFPQNGDQQFQGRKHHLSSVCDALEDKTWICPTDSPNNPKKTWHMRRGPKKINNFPNRFPISGGFSRVEMLQNHLKQTQDKPQL